MTTETYADQRGHDVDWMTAAEREAYGRLMAAGACGVMDVAAEAAAPAGYLTRDQAVARLTRSGATAESAAATLDHALLLGYPHSARTNYHLVTAYRAGTCFGAWPDGKTTADLFTICAW